METLSNDWTLQRLNVAALYRDLNVKNVQHMMERGEGECVL